MVSWASRYAAPSRGHDGEPWSGVVEGKALEEGGVALPQDGGGPRLFLRMEGRIEASRRGRQRSTGTQPDDRRTDTGSSETMPSAGAELRTTRRRGHRRGTVRCSRLGGTASGFRIVIAKAIGMKYLGSPSPAGGHESLVCSSAMFAAQRILPNARISDTRHIFAAQQNRLER